MNDRVTQFRVGVLVVATCIIAGILIILFGEMPGLVSRQYKVFVRFPQAPGVTVDSPVLKSGILIGRVTRVTLLDDGAVVVTASIDSDRKLRNNEVCRISTGNILGDAVLEFVPSGQRVAKIETYGDGDYLDGIVATDPLTVMESATTALQMLANLEGEVRQALVSVEGAGERVGVMAESLTAVVENNSDQLQRILNKTEQAMDRFDFAMSSIDQFVQDDEFKAQLEQAISQVPQLIEDASDVMSKMQVVADKAGDNLDNLAGLTEPLGQRGEQYAVAIERTLAQVDELLAQLGQFSQALNKQDGTLGQLIYNRELYDRLNQTASTINDLTDRVRPLLDRLRPILDDARIFTDKIARDPGRLGVKGALDRRQSGIKR